MGLFLWNEPSVIIHLSHAGSLAELGHFLWTYFWEGGREAKKLSSRRLGMENNWGARWTFFTYHISSSLRKNCGGENGKTGRDTSLVGTEGALIRRRMMGFNRWIIWRFVWLMCSHPFVACIPWNHPQIWQNYVSPRSNNLFFSYFSIRNRIQKIFLFSQERVVRIMRKMWLSVFAFLLFLYSTPCPECRLKLRNCDSCRFPGLLIDFWLVLRDVTASKFLFGFVWTEFGRQGGIKSGLQKKESFCEPIKLTSLFLRGPTSGILVR